MTGGKGYYGEAAARQYLESRGYRYIDSGYTTRFGEIDLIMRDGSCVVFVEVKARKSSEFADARDFVTPAKQKRLRTTAQIWLLANGSDEICRFDVVEVYLPQGAQTENPEINHIENAF